MTLNKEYDPRINLPATYNEGTYNVDIFAFTAVIKLSEEIMLHGSPVVRASCSESCERRAPMNGQGSGLRILFDIPCGWKLLDCLLKYETFSLYADDLGAVL